MLQGVKCKIDALAGRPERIGVNVIDRGRSYTNKKQYDRIEPVDGNRLHIIILSLKTSRPLQAIQSAHHTKGVWNIPLCTAEWVLQMVLDLSQTEWFAIPKAIRRPGIQRLHRILDALQRVHETNEVILMKNTALILWYQRTSIQSYAQDPLPRNTDAFNTSTHLQPRVNPRMGNELRARPAQVIQAHEP
ncbi:hypothetical protein FIBSPDRAFT_895476 [Athelia psychrophila]|uniref:Uncharacterized protein n=1 Tax=Athelia psychrophila TaxID=1759441 RepID=A0A166EIK0_9AGAM|nr:hypothetical protein FIBSPDRAFT_895476 [Fibularhizoctonia sp. CBS 109695]